MSSSLSSHLEHRPTREPFDLRFKYTDSDTSSAGDTSSSVNDALSYVGDSSSYAGDSTAGTALSCAADQGSSFGDTKVDEEKSLEEEDDDDEEEINQEGQSDGEAGVEDEEELGVMDTRISRSYDSGERDFIEFFGSRYSESREVNEEEGILFTIVILVSN